MSSSSKRAGKEFSIFIFHTEHKKLQLEGPGRPYKRRLSEMKEVVP